MEALHWGVLSSIKIICKQMKEAEDRERSDQPPLQQTSWGTVKLAWPFSTVQMKATGPGLSATAKTRVYMWAVPGEGS